MSERRLVVVVDGSPLVDARARAGIGRYVDSLLTELKNDDGLDLHVARPQRPPSREYWTWRFLNAQAAIRTAARRYRPDVVHCMASEPSIAVPVARQVVTVHDVEPWTRSSSFARRDAPYFAFQRSRVRRCGAVIVVSDVTRDQTIETLHVDPSRLHVIPEGVSSVFTPEPSVDDERLRAAAGVGERPYVLWVGSLAAYDPRKALDVLVDAVAASTAKPTLVLAGAGGAGQAEVRRLAEQHHLAVSFPGFVPDETLAALYRGANAAVLASLHEGFGLPALEAMACGAVTIVSRAGNLPDLVDVAAIVVPPGDRQALTNAIDESSTDTVLRARLRGRGPVVAARYRWGRVAAMTRDVYESVARRR